MIEKAKWPKSQSKIKPQLNPPTTNSLWEWEHNRLNCENTSSHNYLSSKYVFWANHICVYYETS